MYWLSWRMTSREDLKGCKLWKHSLSLWLALIIFCRFLQVSSRASIVNQVYGLEATRKLLIWRSSSASWLKSAWAELSEERKASWASRSALISSSELQRTGSVRSSSAFSNQLLKADAFFAKVRNRSSTWKRENNLGIQLCSNANILYELIWN